MQGALFQPDVINYHRLLAGLTDGERAALAECQRTDPPPNQCPVVPPDGLWVPPLGQLWAIGFLFVVDNWPRIWSVESERGDWFDETLNPVGVLATRATEALRMHDDGSDKAFEDVFAMVTMLRYAQRRLGAMPSEHGDGQK